MHTFFTLFPSIPDSAEATVLKYPQGSCLHMANGGFPELQQILSFEFQSGPFRVIKALR